MHDYALDEDAAEVFEAEIVEEDFDHVDNNDSESNDSESARTIRRNTNTVISLFRDVSKAAESEVPHRLAGGIANEKFPRRGPPRVAKKGAATSFVPVTPNLHFHQ